MRFLRVLPFALAALLSPPAHSENTWVDNDAYGKGINWLFADPAQVTIYVHLR